ncbi:MAG: sialate O-acetylesterase [Planctomycetota bacterium]
MIRFLPAFFLVSLGIGPGEITFAQEPPAATASPTEIDVFVFAGQSNMVGFDADAEELPADERDERVLFWYSVGAPPPDSYDSTSKRSWTTLGTQPKGNPPPYNSQSRQYGNFKHASGFGPEIGFARTLLDESGETSSKSPAFAILKVAYSGTSVEKDWDPRQADEPESCYAALLREVRLASEQALTQGYKLRPAGFFWIQGESDSYGERLEFYENRLHQMLLCLREDLKATGLPCFLGVNTRFGEGRNQGMPRIIAQQKSLAQLPSIAYVDTSKATIANPQHYDSKGTLHVGELIAKAYLLMGSR